LNFLVWQSIRNAGPTPVISDSNMDDFLIIRSCSEGDHISNSAFILHYFLSVSNLKLDFAHFQHTLNIILGQGSSRNRWAGSVFIYTLVKTLMKHCCHRDLPTLLLIVSLKYSYSSCEQYTICLIFLMFFVMSSHQETLYHSF